MTKYIYADPKKSIPDWLPGVERVNGNDAGAVLPGSKWSLLLHTTEGSTIEGAISALRKNNSWSHFIYDPVSDRLVQAVPLNKAARSLRSGGNFGKTNAARVIQVEIVGFASKTTFWSADINRKVGKMIRRIANHVPFDVSMPLEFYGDRSGFTVASEKAKQRMSWFNWYRFNAISGHQHAPGNSHWDPGQIQTNQILAAAREEAAKPNSNVPAKSDVILPKFPNRTLRPGEVSNDVSILKLMLIGAGYGHGIFTDAAGAKKFDLPTVLAVKKIMAQYYMEIGAPEKQYDGSVGPIAWGFINKVLEKRHKQGNAYPPRWEPPKFPGRTMKFGDNNGNVAVLKMVLHAAGFPGGIDFSADKVNSFDVPTSNNVIKSQKLYNLLSSDGSVLEPNGKVDVKTWEWLVMIIANKKYSEK